MGGCDAAVILGSGWGPMTASWPAPTASCSYEEAGLRPPCAPGHEGRLSLIEHGGCAILVFSGRTHLYEGHGPQAVAHNVHVACRLGARLLVLTNANGSLVPQWPLGQIVALSDHLNLTGTSPLVGANFVDLTEAYDGGLREAFVRAAKVRGVDVAQGVYAMLPGPHYESAAEARAIRALGADILGMSTVLETIAARSLGMKVLALSTVTAHEASGEDIDPDEVVAIAETEAGKVGPALLATVVSAVGGAAT